MGTTVNYGLCDRFYNLFIPIGIAANAPLVICLHPGLSNATAWQEELGLDAISESAATKYYIAYPHGGGFFAEVDGELIPRESWNVGRGMGISFLLNQPDIEFMQRLIHKLINSLSVDTSRIYIVGYSNGAMLAYSYIATYPGVVCRIVSFSGALMLDDDDLEDNINTPIHHFHGTADDIVPIAGYINDNTPYFFGGVVRSLADTTTLMEARGCTVTTTYITGASHYFNEENAFGLPNITDLMMAQYGKTPAQAMGEVIALDD